MTSTTGERWYAQPLADLTAALQTDALQGLSSQEAARRLQQWGPNILQQGRGVSLLSLLLRQFQSLVIWVLIGAAVVSMALGEVIDGSAILAIVCLNAIIGCFQEYRAERAVAALARLTAPQARVLRAGQATSLAASEVVCGDLLLLEAGDLVAADARLLEATALRSNEAPLTGESQPVEKRADLCPIETPLAERHNMVFLGTSIVAGGARALVVATGMQTEVGHIATLLATARRDRTPLQQRLDQVGRALLLACLSIVVLVFALGYLRALPPYDLFLTAVSLAVASIPEGLPTVVTIALALGVQRMVRRHALVRRLPSVETLGCVQVICSDKTGTLTLGEMTVRQVTTCEQQFTVSGEGYSAEGAFLVDAVECAVDAEPVLGEVLLTAMACNDAAWQPQATGATAVGDPTEVALLVAAVKGGLVRDRLEATMPRQQSIPFDSTRQRMTVIRVRDGKRWAFVKGAPEVIVERCAQVLTRQGVRDLTEQQRACLHQSSTQMARTALRVLALASRPLEAAEPEADVERRLTFLGFVGLQDPPRPEARQAIRHCQQAGIRTVMITGDHPDTARAMATELGLLLPGDRLLVGPDLEHLNNQELALQVPSIAVYARVTAAHKLRIVRAWKARGAVVAMTGDGVNDAPALQEASIGVAMGRTGTEVTKEAADMIITDDNFASIVAAVEEGRGIYDNIRKTLSYLLAGNLGELMVMCIASLAGWPLPLLPIQLLWINLVTDGLPALALAREPIDSAVLDHPPRPPEAQMIDGPLLKHILLLGCLSAGVTLSAFALLWHSTGQASLARSAAFFVLVSEELLRSLSMRSRRQTLWQLGLWSNTPLCLTVLGSLLLQLLVHHVPVLQRTFGALPLSWSQGLLWLALGAVPMLLIELHKACAHKTAASA